MDEQKKIEEMARDFADKQGYGCSATTLNCKECILQCDCMPYSYAKSAYNAGYRKESETAEKFAADSHSKLGKIKRATQGQFSITERDSNTPYMKNVRVVTNVDYYLKD